MYTSNVLIILTSTVTINENKTYLTQRNAEERASTYVRAIKQWLEQTSLKICVVENSGYQWPELDEYKETYNDRFEIMSFDEKETSPDSFGAESKGHSEMLSIKTAFYNSKFKNDINFVIKITARYFIPEFQGFLEDNRISERVKNIGIIDEEDAIVALRQNSEYSCEIVGIHKKFVDQMFDDNILDCWGGYHRHVEDVYRSRKMLFDKTKVLVCPVFTIEPTPTGGDSNLRVCL